ncbi:hypothetical protein NMY22_g15401 [Coprinellus aureogranulatus]|nr:hypothetical protein NMY22_g15401 [Coprinellus aureogranulatus]
MQALLNELSELRGLVTALDDRTYIIIASHAMALAANYATVQEENQTLTLRVEALEQSLQLAKDDLNGAAGSFGGISQG